jgi:hypothetical protein
MATRGILLYFFLIIQTVSATDEILKHSSPVPQGMSRVDLYPMGTAPFK